MHNQDQVVLREIQKNTHMAMEVIDALMPRVKQEEFARELAKQSMTYGKYYEKATNGLKEAKDRLYKDTAGKNVLLRGSIWVQTFMNQSTSHMAEMMIQGANRGITDIVKALNHNKYANAGIKELAMEVMDMEEQYINRMKGYL